MDIVIQAEDLTKRFGDFIAVDHVSFQVQAGDVVGYLGPNGSGKTTTIRLLLGLLQPTEGMASVLGFDAQRETVQVRQQVGYMSQKFALYHDLSIGENLAFYAGVYGVSDRSRRQEVLSLVGLAGRERELVRDLSTGWQQRLALATAIVHRPRLLFLDEPTSGVDPAARRTFWELIYELAEQGVSAFVTTHYMDEAEYCQRVGIMQNGHLLAIDTPATLKSQVVKGSVWEVKAQPLLPALNALTASRSIVRVRLSGDRIIAIAKPDAGAHSFRSILDPANIAIERVRLVEPTLEDVFLALA